nr:MAG TPA: hypothetical protein [Caudoviricetes sp.]
MTSRNGTPPRIFFRRSSLLNVFLSYSFCVFFLSLF